MLYHSGVSRGAELVLPGGFIGVDVFFVLSGYLITALLVVEWEQDGRISLPHFYARRALRLLPALSLLLLAYLAVGWWLTKGWQALLVNAGIVLFYAANWARALGRDLPILGHTWSLSIEEQFYLLWPPIVVVLLRLGLTRRGLAAVALGGALLAAAARVALGLAGASFQRLYNGLDTRADALLVGCFLGAVLVPGMRRWKGEGPAVLG